MDVSNLDNSEFEKGDVWCVGGAESCNNSLRDSKFNFVFRPTSPLVAKVSVKIHTIATFIAKPTHITTVLVPRTRDLKCNN